MNYLANFYAGKSSESREQMKHQDNAQDLLIQEVFRLKGFYRSRN